MKTIGCDISEFMKRTKDKEVVCWGAGYWLRHLSDTFGTGVEKCFSYVVDSNKELWGAKVTVGKKELDIRPPQCLYDTISDRTALLITFHSSASLLEELNLNPKFDDVECYSAPVLSLYEKDKILYSVPLIPDGYRMNETPQIPKVLHYLWFDDKPMPDEFIKYLDSWRKHCPNYEIVGWNKCNYDLASHPYTRDAAAIGHFSAASDYARLDIVYRHGGIYFDLDVEFIRNIDELLYFSAFCGFHNIRQVNTGQGFGARPHHPMVKLLRDAYDTLDFPSTKKTSGTYITCPEIQTPVLQKHGLKLNGKFQIVCDMAILPTIYLNPYSLATNAYYASEQTYSIHHFAASWLSEEERAKHRGSPFAVTKFKPTHEL